MYSDDSLDEYDDNIEYLNDFNSPGSISPIPERSKALTGINLQDLNEINDLSASNQSFASPLKYTSNQALVEQITQSQTRANRSQPKTVQESILDYDFDAEFIKLKVAEEKRKKKPHPPPAPPKLRKSQSKSASSYLDRYFQNVATTTIPTTKSPVKSDHRMSNNGVFKWKSPQAKQYFNAEPEKSQRRKHQPIEKTHINRRLEETDIRLSQSLPRGFSETYRQSVETLDDPILLPVYQPVVEREHKSPAKSIPLKRVKSEPVPNGYLAALREKKSPTYRQRTLKEFKNMMHLEKDTVRGGLGPQAAPEHEVAKIQRITNYSEALRQAHRAGGLKRDPMKKVDPLLVELEEKRNQRKRTLQFAAQIPRPPVPASTTNMTGTKNAQNRTQSTRTNAKPPVEDDVLERLLARHRNEQARVTRLTHLAKIN